MSSLRDLTRSPTPHSISGISLNSSGPVVTKSARLARSPVSVKSVPSKLHDVSDGIRPPTTKAYEKNISCCKGWCQCCTHNRFVDILWLIVGRSFGGGKQG